MGGRTLVTMHRFIEETARFRGMIVVRSKRTRRVLEHATSPNPSTDVTGGAGWSFILRPPFLAGLPRCDAQRRPS